MHCPCSLRRECSHISPASRRTRHRGVSPHSGQTAVGRRARTQGQDVSLVTHKVIIRYMPGLKSRMFLVYNDHDNGIRRFDIDRIVDIDEQKFQLDILAHERCDGADPFDALLTSTADILVRDRAAGDRRGMSDPAFTSVATGIPCRVAANKVAPKGKEDRAKS